MPRGQHLTRAALVAALALLAAGCARPVAVEPPTPDAEAAQVCAGFVAALPAELVVGARRDVEPASRLTAAYGDPPVAIRCGVPVPGALGDASTLVTVEGIDWLAEELTRGWLMTTVGRVAGIEVTVPDEQGPAPSVAADLAPAIRATVPAA